MRHKQSIIVTTIGLFIVLFIVVFTDNDEHVTPRSASFHFQHISIAEQPNENEQQTIKEPIEEQIEEAPEEETRTQRNSMSKELRSPTMRLHHSQLGTLKVL